MTRTYRVIDSDGHVLEPVDIWDRYLDPKYRGRARIYVDAEGKCRMSIDEQVVGPPDGFGRVGAIGHQNERLPPTMQYTDGRKGGFDPHERIKDLDLDGIDAVFLYPSLGLFSGTTKDEDLAWAMCRAYNRWLADYCAPYPDRLFGVAMLPMQSIERSIEEMRFARRELGMRGGFLRPNPYKGRMAGHPDNDALWAEAQELDFCIGFHEGGVGGGGSMPTVGVDRFTSYGAKHMVSHTLEMMLAALSVIWGGVCERFPRIRIAFLESGGGWMAPWLDRMDRHFSQKLFNDSGLTMRPSDLFRRNCWISFEPVEATLSMLADYLGPNHILWATDYPHLDGFFPGAPAMIAAHAGPSETRKHEVLAGGAMAFYGLQ